MVRLLLLKENNTENTVTKLVVSQGNLVSISFDDTVKISPLSSLLYGPSIPIEGQPVGVACHGDNVYIVTHEKFVVIQNGEVTSQSDLGFESTCIAVHPDGGEVSIGGKDNKIHVFNLDGTNITQKYLLADNPGYITCLDYSHDGRYLASGDSSRQVRAWEGDKCKQKMWVFHTTTITCVSWNPDNEHVVSGSVDTNLIVWSITKPLKRIVINGAHFGGVTGCCWLDNVTVASVGDDCSLKTWNITHH